MNKVTADLQGYIDSVCQSVEDESEKEEFIASFENLNISADIICEKLSVQDNIPTILINSNDPKIDLSLIVKKANLSFGTCDTIRIERYVSTNNGDLQFLQPYEEDTANFVNCVYTDDYSGKNNVDETGGTFRSNESSDDKQYGITLSNIASFSGIKKLQFMFAVYFETDDQSFNHYAELMFPAINVKFTDTIE